VEGTGGAEEAEDEPMKKLVTIQHYKNQFKFMGALLAIILPGCALLALARCAILGGPLGIVVTFWLMDKWPLYHFEWREEKIGREGGQ
jgi:hypothetical protein